MKQRRIDMIAEKHNIVNALVHIFFFPHSGAAMKILW